MVRVVFWNMNRWAMPLTVAELAWQENADVVILAECGADPAALLGEKTKQLLKAEVTTQTTGTLLVHSFYLVAPTLGYRYELFRASHHASFYPLNVDYISTTTRIMSEAELKQKLKEIFSAQHTVNTVQSILATVQP
jgi:hypothetical protein